MASLVSGTTKSSRMTWREGEAGFAFAAERESDGAEVHEAGDVLGVDDADDVLGAGGGVVDGDAGVLLVDDAGGGLLERACRRGGRRFCRGGS